MRYREEDVNRLLKNGLTEQQLLELPDDVFRGLMDEDLHRRDDARDDWTFGPQLRSPTVIRRFYAELLRKSKSVEGQLASLDADFDATKSRLKGKITISRLSVVEALDAGNQEALVSARRKLANQEADLERERSKFKDAQTKKLRFKTGLDMTIIEVRGLIERMDDELNTTIRDLRQAIQEHHDRCLAGDDEAADRADEILWRVLGAELKEPA